MTLIVLPIPYTMITISVIKYQFLDILPLTLSDAVETIDDGFLVINVQKKIEDYNQVFFERFMEIEVCKTFDDFLADISSVTFNRAVLDNLKYSLNVRGESYISGEIAIEKDGVERVLQYTSKAINDYHNIKIATIITFHDITEIQSLYREYEVKKQELMVARSKLEEHTATVQMLSIETERNKLMSEVHDTLGHSMTELLAIMEKCDIMLSNEEVEVENAKEVITHALYMARETLAEIRSAVTKFREMGYENDKSDVCG